MKPFQMPIWLLFLLASAIGCSNSMMPSASSFSATTTTRARAMSDPLPLPTDSGIIVTEPDMSPLPYIVPYQANSEPYHSLTSTEVSAIMDPSADPDSSDFLSGFLASSHLPEFVPNSGSSNVNIIFVNALTGKTYVNRPDLSDVVLSGPPIEGSAAIPKAPDLTLHYYPYEPQEDPNSGPYRRIVSDENNLSLVLGGIRPVATTRRPEYTESSADTFTGVGEGASANLYCQNGDHSPGDVSTIYLGGYSGQWGAYKHGAYSEFPTQLAPFTSVDAGVQYLYRPYAPLSQDNYQPFLRFAAPVGYAPPNDYENVTSGTTMISPQSPHTSIPCGVQVREDYQVDASLPFTTTAGLSYPAGVYFVSETSYYNQEVGNYQITAIIMGFPGLSDVAGWSQTCIACTVKRMSSIAQNLKQDFTNEDAMNTIWTDGILSCGFYPSGYCPNQGMYNGPWNLAETENCTEYPNWQNAFDGQQRDCTPSPNKANDVVFDDFQLGDTPWYAYQEHDRIVNDRKPTPLPVPTPGTLPTPPSVRVPPVIRPIPGPTRIDTAP